MASQRTLPVSRKKVYPRPLGRIDASIRVSRPRPTTARHRKAKTAGYGAGNLEQLKQELTARYPGFNRAERQLFASFGDILVRLDLVRDLEPLLLRINRALSTDITINSELADYRALRNGIISNEVLGNLARYEIHLMREVEAIAELLGHKNTALHELEQIKAGEIVR